LLGGGTHTGDITGATGSTLQLGGIHNFEPGADITGGLNVWVTSANINDFGRINTTGTVTLSSTSLAIFQSSVTTSSLLITSGTNHFNGSISAPGGTISGGTLTGSGTWHVTSTLNWSGGQIAGTAGQLFIDSGGTLNSSGSNKSLGRNLTNNGTTNWTAGTLNVSNSTFQNNGSFTANSAANQTFTRSVGTNVFNNVGSFIKKNSSTMTFTEVAFNNAGTVDVQAGALSLAGGGTHTGDFTSSGTDTTLNIGGNHTFASGSDITGISRVYFIGSGTITGNGLINTTSEVGFNSTGATTMNGSIKASRIVVSAGTATLNGPLDAPMGAITGGTLAGSADWTITSGLSWVGGTIAGTGRLIFDPFRSLAILNLSWLGVQVESEGLIL
jgi:hypothetical protein